MISSGDCRFVCVAAIISLASAFGVVASAQDLRDDSPPAHIGVVEGAATLERDGQLDVATVNTLVIAGDRLRTSDGRMEILFADATVLDVDEGTVVDVVSSTLLTLAVGRARLTIGGAGDPSRATRYQVDTPAASVRIEGPGEFRITVFDRRSDQTELAVARGQAVLLNDRGAVTLRAGEQSAALDGEAPARIQPFNPARFDPFDRWVADLRSARATTPTSAQYLPSELRSYGEALERDGAWQYQPPYGYVWYPTVGDNWQPYSNGYWSSVGSYGLTWTGADLWAWPTHHYGRWGHSGRAWFWIPGRTWGPAWVSWAAEPGYVSWCPLGFDGRPVFALVFGDETVRRGWTIVPRASFGERGVRIDRYAVAAHQLPRSTPFIALTTPPRRAGDTRGVRVTEVDRSGRGAATGVRRIDGNRISTVAPPSASAERTAATPGPPPADAGRPRDGGRLTSRPRNGAEPRPGVRSYEVERRERQTAAKPPTASPVQPQPTVTSQPAPPAARNAPVTPPPAPPAASGFRRPPEAVPQRPSPPPARGDSNTPGGRPRGDDGGERAAPRGDAPGAHSRGEGRRR